MHHPFHPLFSRPPNAMFGLQLNPPSPPTPNTHTGIVFDMGQRERKPTMNYDVDSYYRSAMKVGGVGEIE
jgi:hypothetical protein